MEGLRLRDVGSVPGLLSLARLPLAAAFPFAIRNPYAALAILIAAAVSDVLDGWYARHWGPATPTGAILDPVMDKVFVATVVVTLLLAGRLSFCAALLLGARDILQLPLAVWLVIDGRALANSAGEVKANAFGKVATVLQFGTVGAALLAARYVDVLALCSGVSGLIAGASYWPRVLRRGRAEPSGPQAPLSNAGS